MDNYKVDLVYFVVYIVPVILLWIRFESRLSRVEGRFDLALSLLTHYLKGGVNDG